MALLTHSVFHISIFNLDRFVGNASTALKFGHVLGLFPTIRRAARDIGISFDEQPTLTGIIDELDG